MLLRFNPCSASGTSRSQIRVVEGKVSPFSQVSSAPRPRRAAEKKLELERLGDVAVLDRQGADQTEPEGGVGHLIEDGRPGGQDAVLDAQMRLPVGPAIAGAVPPVDGAVMQPQSLQLGDLAPFQGGERVFLDIGRHQGAEACDVLLEQLEDRIADPMPAEVDPRTAIAQVVNGSARVDRLLKEGDARLAPQLAPEQERRVGRRRDHRRRHHLGNVIQVR
jgi:hypothetical protein